MRFLSRIRGNRASAAAGASLPTPLTVGLLAAVFLLAGLFGRDPWKADEPYSFGMTLTFLEGNDWVVPKVAGEPFLEKPPLMYWTGAVTAKVCAPWLPLHDGARVAVLGFVLIALWATARMANDALGREARAPALGLMCGTAGLWLHAHTLMAAMSPSWPARQSACWV